MWTSNYWYLLILDIDVVNNITLDSKTPGFLNIDFKEPTRNHGAILKYRIKITSIEIDFCKMVKIIIYLSVSL